MENLQVCDLEILIWKAVLKFVCLSVKSEYIISKKDSLQKKTVFFGAGNETRTRYLHLGKVALYRMSYARIRNVLNSTTNFSFVKHQISRSDIFYSFTAVFS